MRRDSPRFFGCHRDMVRCLNHQPGDCGVCTSVAIGPPGPHPRHSAYSFTARCWVGWTSRTRFPDGRALVALCAHTLGPALLSGWYRPPDDPMGNLQSFIQELAEHTAGAISTIIVGDMDIHHKSWLSYSVSDTPAGRELWNICKEFGLRQLVNAPTHVNGNLLDWVSSSAPKETNAIVCPWLADHQQWKRVKWDAIRSELRRQDWSFLEQDPIDDATQKWTEIILGIIDRHVPSVEIAHSKPSHPGSTNASRTS